MNTVKRFVIWLAAMLAVILLADALGCLRHFIVTGNLIRGSMDGKARKMTFPLEEPQNEDEEKRNSAILKHRAAWCDYAAKSRVGLIGNILYENYRYDVTNITLNRDGWYAFSTGVFAKVYRDYGEPTDYALHCFGLIRVNTLAQRPEAAAFADALKQYPNSKLRLDAYIIESNNITPVSVTLLDDSGAELQTVTFAADGDVIEADDCYIYNSDAIPKDDENTDPMLWMIRLAQSGTRPSDPLAQKYVEELPAGADYYEDDALHIGICSIAFIHSEISNGYALVSVQQITYTEGVIFYSVIFGVIMTVVLLNKWRKTPKRQNTEGD